MLVGGFFAICMVDSTTRLNTIFSLEWIIVTTQKLHQQSGMIDEALHLILFSGVWLDLGNSAKRRTSPTHIFLQSLTTGRALLHTSLIWVKTWILLWRQTWLSVVPHAIFICKIYHVLITSNQIKKTAHSLWMIILLHILGKSFCHECIAISDKSRQCYCSHFYHVSYTSRGGSLCIW